MPNVQTSLHYTANGNVVNGVYQPGADGFNLADISSVDELNALPAGVEGLVYLSPADGATTSFQATVDQFIGDPKLFGFYLADEPDPSVTSAADLKAESDYIHANVPGAKTYMTLENMGSDTSPTYLNTYNPANTDIDLFGLDPYPVQSQFSGGIDLAIIPAAVQAAEAAGIPQKQLVPVYQTFGTNGTGAYAPWLVPTAAQLQQILSSWGSVLPNPTFDYAYSWGTQDGDQALSDLPALQQVMAVHNGIVPTPTPTPTVLNVPATETNVAVTISDATINATSGSHVFLVSGSADTFNLSGGLETITDSVGDNIFNLPAAGNGSAVFNSAALTDGDLFNLETALASTNWPGSTSSLNAYLHAERSGSNTELLVSQSASGRATGTVLATFDNIHASLATILAQSIT